MAKDGRGDDFLKNQREPFPKIKANYRQRGAYYEDVCAAWLEKHNYKIIEKNYRCRTGEIDLVGENEGYLVFIEVKFRQNKTKGAPYEAVGHQKQMTIRRAALWYIKTHNIRPDNPVRFDVVSICGGNISLYKNAFF